VVTFTFPSATPTRQTAPHRAIPAEAPVPAARGSAKLAPATAEAAPSTASSIGASIIAREQRRLPTLALAIVAAAAAVAGVATYVLLSGGPPDPAPADALDPAPASTPAPAAAVPAAAPPTRMVVRSTPSGMEVSIDGALVDGVTPIDIEVVPGRHLVAVESDGEVLWRDEVEVAAGSHFELHPVVVAPRDHGRDDHKRDRARYRAPILAAPEPHAAGADDRLVAAAAPVMTAPSPAPPPVSAPPPVPRKLEPVLVPPNAVSKRSGSVPTLRARDGAEVPRMISAQLCIDDGGRVTSAKLISKVPDELSGTLIDALESWRYRPYRDDTGAHRAACFAVVFRSR
jgi:hypothetical protein